MNFYSLAPLKYKRSVVTGFVHRIYRACSSWRIFHHSLEKGKQILSNNQYPISFFEPLINTNLENIFIKRGCQLTNEESNDDEEIRCLYFLQYRGKITEEYISTLRRIQAPCKPVLTLRKLKTVLPPLKPPVEKALKSRIVYQIKCSRCDACYVGQTDRHIHTRFKEHLQPSKPVGQHFNLCGASSDFFSEDVCAVMQSTHRSILYLETLEAIWQRKIKPKINTRDEFRKRELTIKF